MAKPKNRNRLKEAQAYFRATEEVSKPVAFLMLFFGFTFLISLIVGVFLLGRWGYQQITDSDQKTTVSIPAVNDNGGNTATGPPANNTTTTTQSSASVAVTSPDGTSVNRNVGGQSTLPNTGGWLNIFVVMMVFLASTFIHRQYFLKKLTS